MITKLNILAMKSIIITLLIYSLSQIYWSKGVNAQGMEMDKSGMSYSNPVLIEGSDFASVFQSYYKQGNWEMLLRLTSKNSLNRFGREKILAYYQRMQFGYEIELMSLTQFPDFFQLNYRAIINATNKVIRINVSVENDTCRIVLGNRMRVGEE